jgi:hypothetical protein
VYLNFEIPSPNTTVFSVLWPPSIAAWGSLVFPYTLVVQYVPDPPIYEKMVGFPIVSVAGVARGATENAECDGVGQLSDPLEGHVI